MASRVSPERGALAIVTNVGRDAVDDFAPEDERRKKRTAKSCGPDAPTLASSERQHPLMTGTIKPGPRGELEVSRNTIAQGMPDRSAYLW